MQQSDRRKGILFDMQQSMRSARWSDGVGKHYEATAK